MAQTTDTAATTSTTTRSRAGLPTERAFVVQLRADADLARGPVTGRVEHIVSGVAALFGSVAELCRFMRDTVAPRDRSEGD